MRGVAAVAIKELRQIRRDRRSLVILLFIPVFFLFLYGYALNFDIRHVTLAIEDRDHSAESRALVAAFVRSAYFDRVATVENDEQVDSLMNRGQARALLVIPEGFTRRVFRGEPIDLQVVLNGDNANTATTVLGYVNGVLTDAAAQLGGPIRASSVGVIPRVWYNPELRSALFLVPGLIAYIATISAVVSTSLSIVREKENGTIEQIRMAPISTLSYVLGKTIPYLVLAEISAFLIVVAAMAMFGLPMRGDWATLFIVLTAFLVGGLGTGLLVSTVSDTQQAALQASMLLAFLPVFMLSGFIFPIASMPLFLQQVTKIVPAKYFLIALRGVVLKGLGLSEVLMPLLALVIFAVAVIGLSALRLARR
jgi:drug efflux transport system permease protein